MLKIYLKIAFRHFWKNGVYLSINILGLAIALAMCHVAYLHVDFGLSIDKFHENYDKIYRISTQYTPRKDYNIRTGLSFLPLGDSLKHYPEVKKSARIASLSVIVTTGKKVQGSRVFYVEPEFLDIFSFPLKLGKRTALKDTNKIILSQGTAEYHFGNRNPVGKKLKIKYKSLTNPNKGVTKEFIVGGVLEKIPDNSNIYPYIITSFNAFPKDTLKPWQRRITANFLLIENPSKAKRLEKKLQKYIKYYNKSLAKDNKLIADEITILTLKDSTDPDNFLYNNGFGTRMSFSMMIIPTGIALSILLLATLNLVNSSINLVGKRLKEIGVKRVIGARKWQIIRQFILESMILVFIALLFSLAFAELLLLGWNPLFSYHLSVSYLDINFLIFLVILLIILSLIIGAYAGFYVNTYNPIQIIQVKNKIGTSSILGRVLLGFQFGIACIALYGGIISFQNYNYHLNFDYGFDKDKVFKVNVGALEDKRKFIKKLKSNPNIKKWSFSQTLIGQYDWSTRIKTKKEDLKVGLVYGDHNYAQTLGLRLKKGRFFDKKKDKVKEKKAIINEEAIKKFNLGKDPIGKKIMRADTVFAKVIGVVENFYEASIQNSNYKMRPAVVKLIGPEKYDYLSVRTTKGKKKVTQEKIIKEWNKLAPDTPIQQIEHIIFSDNFEETHKAVIRIFYFVAFIASLISLSALYSNISLEVVRRTKEIGIRKTYGASVWDIINLLNRKFLSLIIIAFAFATLIMYFSFYYILNELWGIYTQPFTTYIYVFLAINLLSFLTISLKIRKIAYMNPVKSLRYE